MEIEPRRRFRVRLNLIPLVNVIFLLLIFFILSGTIRSPEPFGLQTPESESGETSEFEPLYEPIELALAPDGKIAINGEEITRARLAEALAAHISEQARPAVTFKADARAGTGEMIDLLRELRLAGARLVLLETRPPRDE